MKKQFFILIVIACVCGLRVPAVAQSCVTATCTATSPSESDFLAALPSSGNTNATVTVNIPSGASTWTTGFLYTVPAAVKSLTIQGNTAVTCSGTPGTAGYSCSAVDNTVINDDVTNPNTPLWVINTSSATTLFRITGITIQPLNSSVTAKSQGIVNFSGNTKNFRWDHSDIVISQNDNSGPEFDGQIEGVFDHNLMQLGNISNFTNGVRIFNDLFDTAGFGDGGWASATQWGSQHAIFIESSYIVGGYTTDCDVAGREVIRYNTFSNAQDAGGAVHSVKDPGGAERGCRSEEFYHNYASTSVPGNTMTGGEGSTLIEWGNTLGTVANTFYTGEIWRSQAGQVPNEPAGLLVPNGWAMCGTDPGYPAGSPSISAWDGNSSTATGYPCLDDIGRGQQTQAMNGANFPSRINTATGTQSWPHQYLEPAYFWMNTIPSGMGAYLNIGGTALNNRDYFFDCNSYNSSCSGGFTGRVGTGYGLLSARPSACTAGPGGTYGTSPTGSYGVGYWATDTNTLYVCTAPNTWTAIYQPYTYPHPLVGGNSTTGSAPAAPTNLVSTAD